MIPSSSEVCSSNFLIVSTSTFSLVPSSSLVSLSSLERNSDSHVASCHHTSSSIAPIIPPPVWTSPSLCPPLCPSSLPSIFQSSLVSVFPIFHFYLSSYHFPCGHSSLSLSPLHCVCLRTEIWRLDGYGIQKWHSFETVWIWCVHICQYVSLMGFFWPI